MSDTFVTVDARPEEIDQVREPGPAPYQRIRSLISPGTTLLDVGCGNGKIGAYFQAAGAIVDGIEPATSRAAVARARLRYVSTDWAGPTFSDPGLGTQYDLITFLDVVEHLPDPQPVLDWAATLLSPGGAVCAMIPNSAHWSFRWKMLRGDWHYTPHGGLFDRTHVRFFSPETAAMLRPAGTVEESRTFSGFGPLSRPQLISVRPRLFAMHTLFIWRRVGGEAT